MMRFLIACALLLCLGCEKKVDSPNLHPFYAVPVNTGYYAYDSNGNFLRVVGIPNIKNGTAPYDREFVMFPNPLRSSTFQHEDSVSCRIFLPVGMSKKVWVLPANYSEHSSSTLNQNGGSFQVVSNTPVFQIETNDQRVDIILPVDQHTDYRVYVELDGELYYDNIAIRDFDTF